MAPSYFTRWVKEIPLRKINDDEVISFVKQYIVATLSVPTLVVFDNVRYFLSLCLYDFSLENNIVLKHLSNYYP